MTNETEFEEIMSASSGVAALAALTRTECEKLWDLLLDVPPGGIVVEVGCQLGRSSSLIAQARKLRGFHSLHIDPYTEQEGYAKGWVEMMLKVSDVREHAFTLCCMRTQQAEWLLSRIGEIDFAFIDGDHMYEGVKADMRQVACRLKRGGVLACHDVDHVDYPGVRQAIEEHMTPAWHTIGQFDSLGVWLRK